MIAGDPCEWRTSMLAEKFFLLLETIRSNIYTDGAPRVVSTSRHVPINLPGAKSESGLRR
jgi:hypothetical protein